VLLGLAYTIGPVSGSHVNPAVTMGALLAGRIPLVEAVGYWVAQFVGGILGALLLWGMFNTSPLYSTSKTGLGTNGWGTASDIHIGMGGAFLAEVVLTALFVFVILGVTSKLGKRDDRGHRHRADPDGGPPHRDTDHRNVGEPGAQPRPGPHRRRNRAEPGVTIHRGPAGRRHRRCGAALARLSTAQTGTRTRIGCTGRRATSRGSRSIVVGSLRTML
jgi:glycerol uptake facilitator-like aquaporin